MFSDSAARELVDTSSEAVLDEAHTLVQELAPSLRGALHHGTDGSAVIRIPHAMPTSPPGRVADIITYRRNAAHRRVVIAGDSHAWPWTDSAAAAGEWAAMTVLGG